jgi:hypothetical protein
MTKDSDPFAFEQFPRGWLAFRTSRGKLLPDLLENLHAYAGETRAFKLDELSTWPDEQLGQIIPQQVPAARISLKDGWVYALPPKASCPLKIFSTRSPALGAFNQMNGKTSLSQIAAVVEEEHGWSGEQAFAYVRGVFLYLVLGRICQPVFPKDEATGSIKRGIES